MCGIVGYTGSRIASTCLLPALHRLEYRGYDSSGLATLNGNGIEVWKEVGRIDALKALLGATHPHGSLGIAHTRWATHGAPSRQNAHPHVDCSGRIAVVHNGIIENFRQLRAALAERGHRFRSPTDTEIVAHLIEQEIGHGLPEAVRRAAARLRGSYAIVCMSEGSPDLLVAARNGSSPLILGRGDGETFVASDVPALLGEAREVSVLGQGEIALLRPGDVRIETFDGAVVERPWTPIEADPQAAEKGGHPHFMLKEILEQPQAVEATLVDQIDPDTGDVRLAELGMTDRELAALHRLCVLACGTSYHAGLVGRALIEATARLAVDVELASEFRHGNPVIDGRTLALAISQSGETADTLGALLLARALGTRTAGICNVVGSSLTREADGVIPTRAGIEIGVAATKTFTTQIAALSMLALKLGVARGFLDRTEARRSGAALHEVPQAMARVLETADDIRARIEPYAGARCFLFLGRGTGHALALEGALKLKEISYIHAEGYAAGEMKHGPIALIDHSVPVVALLPRGPHHEKTCGNVEEALARGGRVIAIAEEGDDDLPDGIETTIRVPAVAPWLQPMVLALPLQLMAYHVGVLRGCDVDKPRNLAKSVTVE
jgi:glucosamine--fructose-6-phosphate aminotransferase (isomerizing)